ncbi:bifunctional glutamate N-acetyltransferase/amino-acid acetyltransferase ArgJ [Methanonatronarchaeum sp. AMET6-2]|uniref:bifunctional glutamate N-acetyltransferase/amino-acid acetyltransferase ArgJ n=1 Tax=Methanonatronarchaeum sp. AMET6-2 TaxID=2933293 RepID=UPI001FF6BB90|nr:bifunctional glutamate N-acetyltransferase/amino-acid acetyltransferase ArgJ [Methanonatronarchaeum sp. AMET6-2]UOY10741.1 bifunctional glutamate N-acetyltransferase/amino-acid acetyltransferase ArgJ [Methanonatronarchaeum sp. AMET6-2]
MKGICSVPGVKANGYKEGGKGLAVIEANGKCVGTFTRNKIQAAPVVYTEKLLSKDPDINHIIVNSGCANAFTGEQGLEDAEWMSRLIGGRNVVCSTGKIGSTINREWISMAIDNLVSGIQDGEVGCEKAADAILTTDTGPKQSVVSRSEYTVGGMAKGAGMIEPNMGTMLAFIFTDIEIPVPDMEKRFKEVVDRTFNMVVVDGDTSTNDTALLTTTGFSETPYSSVEQSLWRDIEEVCRELAKQIARDGEGATKMIEITVQGAKDKEEAKNAVKTTLNSPLVKTAVYGEDPNFGRIVAALGRSEINLRPDGFKVKINGNTVVKKGRITSFDKTKIGREMQKNKINIEIDLQNGSETITGWGCDLTPGYIEINADY